MNYNTQHKFYCGVDLHARSMLTHVLDHKGQTVFEKDLSADPDEFLHAIKPYRNKSWWSASACSPGTGSAICRRVKARI